MLGLTSRHPLAKAAALAALAVACSSAPAAPDDGAPGTLRRDTAAPIQTDTTVYRLASARGVFDAWADAVYTNRTGAPVTYARCGVGADGPIYGLVRTGADSARSHVIGVAWGCVGGVPTGTVPPGGTLRARVWLGSAVSPNANPPIRAEERVGRFRVVFELCGRPERDSDACRPLPRSARESNAFDVTF